MIPARIAVPLRFLIATLVVVAAACASPASAPAPWNELQGDAGGGGFGGAAGTTTSEASSTSSTGGAGGESAGTGGQGGSGGSGGNAQCGDTGPGERNETEATATDLGNITDCDDTGGTVAGVLASVDDVDWYKYTATDDFGCTVDPSRGFSPAGVARLCKFAQCTAGGAATVSCELASTAATSPSGRPGCCHTQSFSMDVDCPGADDDASIFIRVDRPTSDCAAYSLIFHY